jgi:hypothetical protein
MAGISLDGTGISVLQKRAVSAFSAGRFQYPGNGAGCGI